MIVTEPLTTVDCKRSLAALKFGCPGTERLGMERVGTGHLGMGREWERKKFKPKNGTERERKMP